MRALILAGAVLALASGPALAQSPDPTKRDEWARSMARCLEDIDHPDLSDIREAKINGCRHFANEEIKDSYPNRLRAFLRSGETVDEPVSEEVAETRSLAFITNHNLFGDDMLYLEAQIRFSVFEECLIDPAGFTRSDCKRLAGVDRIHEIVNGGETAEEDVAE